MILFFGQSGTFLAQFGKVGELVTNARRFEKGLFALLGKEKPVHQK